MELLQNIVVHASAAAAITFVGIVIGWRLRERHAECVVRKMIEHADKELAKKVEENTIKAKLEIHHGHYYLFNEETDAFLGQGETTEELSAMLREKFPKTTFTLSKESYKELGMGVGNDFTV